MFEMGGVAFKPLDLGNDRGYMAVVVLVWEGLNLNPHPLTAEGAAPRGRAAPVYLEERRTCS